MYQTVKCPECDHIFEAKVEDNTQPIDCAFCPECNELVFVDGARYE